MAAGAAAGAGRFQLYDSDDDTEAGTSSASSAASGNDAANATVWVFGYGSLCWNPGFEFSKCVTGYIRGYVRRFWQGNDSHRGTAEKVSDVRVLSVVLIARAVIAPERMWR